MYCKNTEIFYVLLFLILFVLSHFLLVQYHMNHMSAGQKLSLIKAKMADAYESKEAPHKNGVRPFRSGVLSLNRMALQSKRVARNIIEPPLPKEKEGEYALNVNYFQKLHNYPIFR